MSTYLYGSMIDGSRSHLVSPRAACDHLRRGDHLGRDAGADAVLLAGHAVFDARPGTVADHAGRGGVRDGGKYICGVAGARATAAAVHRHAVDLYPDFESARHHPGAAFADGEPVGDLRSRAAGVSVGALVRRAQRGVAALPAALSQSQPDPAAVSLAQ